MDLFTDTIDTIQDEHTENEGTERRQAACYAEAALFRVPVK